MKNTFVLIAVFLVAFAATLLLTPGVMNAFKPDIPARDPDVEGPPPSEEDRRRADIARTMVNAGAAEAGAKPVELGAADAPGTFEIVGRVRTDDERPPQNLMLGVQPQAELTRIGDDGFRIVGTEGGAIHITAYAEGYMPRLPIEVLAEPGKKYGGVEIWLTRGVSFSGIVNDVLTLRPIQGVRIDFNGEASAITDALGYFNSGMTSPRAIDVVTLTHDEYDQVVMQAPIVPDPHDITWSLGRGTCTVTGSVNWPSGLAAPAAIRVRVVRVQMPGHERLRRERTFRDTFNFEVGGLYDGPYVLEVSFPGTQVSTQRIPFELERGASLHFDVDLRGRGAIDGAFTMPSNLVASHRVELVDEGGHVVGETLTDAEGRFRFQFVPPGKYMIRMPIGRPPAMTSFFTLDEAKPLSIVVEGPFGNLKIL